MYILQFLKRLHRKSNLTIRIYLVLNYLLISFFIIFLIGDFLSSSESYIIYLVGFGAGLVLYFISLTIALSSFGEWLLRLQCQCHEISDLGKEASERIITLFEEVYTKAREEDNSIASDVKLYYSESDDENAWAMGRKTITVTTAMIQNSSDAVIKGVLGHEFGHLAHKDTDMLLLVTVGNMIITALITVIKLIIIAASFIFKIMGYIAGVITESNFASFLAKLSADVMSFLSIIFINLFMWIWTQIGNLLVLKSNRAAEYDADEFSFRLGYGEAIMHFLDSLGDTAEKSKLGILISSHPPTPERIRRLKEMLDNQKRELEEKKIRIENVADSIVRKMESNGAEIPVFSAPENTEHPEFSLAEELKSAVRHPAAAVVPNTEAQRKLCPHCGASIKKRAKFCVKCGMQC